MVLLREYDRDRRLDRVWYSSSNIVYSECEDRENDYKTLRVVFRNGARYEYRKVDVNDYVMFVNGGLDGSNGKALNKFIKPKYEFSRMEDADIKALSDEMSARIAENEKKCETKADPGKVCTFDGINEKSDGKEKGSSCEAQLPELA